MPKPENKSCNGSFWGAYRVSRSANEPPFHKHVKRSQHISIKRIMSQNGGTLFKWLGSYKWLQMTTNQFWGVSSFLCSVIPQLKVWNFPRHAGKWAVQIPPPTVPTPSKKSCVFFVFAYWFLETKTWLCWMSCFFSISYIFCVYSVWDGWVSVSQTIVFLCRGLDFLEQRKQAPKAHSTNLLKSRITKVYTANALPASHGGWGESEKNSKYCWWFFRNPGWKPPGMYKTL